jgi:hypothetical protein
MQQRPAATTNQVTLSEGAREGYTIVSQVLTDSENELSSHHPSYNNL